jgi:hypothetical protein
LSLDLPFLVVFAGSLALLFWWGFRTLPAESWQFLASAATHRGPDGEWAGVNFTFYGLFSALAYTSAAALFLVLTAAAGVTPWAAFATLAAILAVCLPASTWLVRVVERKQYGFTVGGASFVGFVATPFVASGVAAVSERNGYGSVPVLPMLAAMAVAYALGESVGRLACISFGCCYGKPVAETRGWVRRIAARFAFVFVGDTKKAAFASRLAGTPVVPVQAMTSIVLGAVAWTGTALVLGGNYRTAFALTAAGSQAWRVYSETLRADYRGEGRISAYQIMAGIAAALALAFAILWPAGEIPRPDLAAGFAAVGSPASIVLLEVLFALIFWKMGRSTQTGSKISFHVRADRI